MTKLLFVDRTKEDGTRVFHFLQYSDADFQFYISVYERSGDNVIETKISMREYFETHPESDRIDLRNTVNQILSLEIHPSLRIVE